MTPRQQEVIAAIMAEFGSKPFVFSCRCDEGLEPPPPEHATCIHQVRAWMRQQRIEDFDIRWQPESKTLLLVPLKLDRVELTFGFGVAPPD
ncbi:MAG TPA: hypothetical protein VNU21_04135 [Usitatibacter sp.]|nr:hypothetical protein [Usitatibacter sp.]